MANCSTKASKMSASREFRFPASLRPCCARAVNYNGSPVFLSEFGGIAFIPARQAVPHDSWGYSGVEKRRSGAAPLARDLRGDRPIPAFAGICYTQLTDVEQEVNGLLTYDRQMKFDPIEIRRINELLP